MKTATAKRPFEPEIRTRRNYTAEDRAAIYQGCPVTTLADMFQMKRQNVERRLANCPSIGTGSNGMPLYRVVDAAPFLVRIKLTDEQVRETLQRADPKDFPAMTNKMFWEGLMQRRKYEELVNDLWHTSDIVSVASSAFNAIRMALLLLPDHLSDEAGLNEQQRGIVVKTVDTSLESLRDALIDELQKPSRSGPESPPEDGDV